LDLDATLPETHNREAKYCYKKYKAYQPLNVYWAEQALVLLSEFRDGNLAKSLLEMSTSSFLLPLRATYLPPAR
jgi:hypothetical protein